MESTKTPNAPKVRAPKPIAPSDRTRRARTAHVVVQAEPSREARILARSIDLLGGVRSIDEQVAQILKNAEAGRMALHKAMREGRFSYSSLGALVDGLSELKRKDVADVIGVSSRTLERQRAAPDRPMPADVASRTWMLAETIAKAAEVFGGLEQAEKWMGKPAMGLDGSRPIEMLQTVQGAEVVNDFLGRLEYGVYS